MSLLSPGTESSAVDSNTSRRPKSAMGSNIALRSHQTSAGDSNTLGPGPDLSSAMGPIASEHPESDIASGAESPAMGSAGSNDFESRIEGSRYLVRIISGADEDYCIALRGNSVVLSLRDHRDRFQNWFMDERYGLYGKTKKDEDGQSSFALINEASDQAMMLDTMTYCLFAKLCNHPKEPTLWTSNIDQQGRLCIRWLDVPALIVSVSRDQFLDGSFIHLWFRDSSKRQHWKIERHEVPVQLYSTLSMHQSLPTFVISCEVKEGYNLTICNGAVMLAPSNLRDENQHWIKETTYARHVKDFEDKKRAFALVNKATGQAIRHGLGKGHLVRLVKFDPDDLDASILWTEGGDLGRGFRHIRMINNNRCVFDLIGGSMGYILLGIWEISGNSVQNWKIEEL